MADNRQDLLLVAEMMSIGKSRHMRMWSSINSLSEPMDLLFCGHRPCEADGTRAPGAMNFSHRDNRGNPPIRPFLVMSWTQTVTSPSHPRQPQRESAG